jgi:isopentenyl-diphosphate delta-isomerase
MKESKVIIVNEKDEIIGYKERDDRNQNDIIRIAGVWIENEKNEVLIAQRSFDKVNDPGKWGPAAAGTLEYGETYESNILKEVEEEIGISLSLHQLNFLGSFFEETSHKYFVGTFFVKIDSATKFVLQKEEVEDIKWISWEDLEKDIIENPDNYLLSLERGIMKRIKDWKEKYEK